MPGIEALIISIVVAGACSFAAVDRLTPADWQQPTRPFRELQAETGALAAYVFERTTVPSTDDR